MNGSEQPPTGDPVHAEVVAAGRSAVARATVERGAMPPSAHQAAAARAWLVVAEASAASGDHRGARDAATQGLDALGDEYVDPGDGSIEDDTATKLYAATTTDDEPVRATLLTRVLEARLEMYRWRHEPAGLRFDPGVGDEPAAGTEAPTTGDGGAP